MKKRTFTKFLILLMVLSVNFLDMTAKKKSPCPQVLVHTTMGDMTIELFNETPIHRDNFLKLVSQNYYDSLLFHRVISDFMIQGGDPDSRTAPAGKLLGEGGPNETLPAEIDFPKHYHLRGSLCAAREDDSVNPEHRSNGSQFYLVYGKTFTSNELNAINKHLEQTCHITLPSTARHDYETIGGTPHLDGQYTVFGRIVKGLNVLYQIQKVQTDRNDRPRNDVRILSMTVIKN